MRTQKIYFPHRQALCVFPEKPSDLDQAIANLQLNNNYPVIVLIGGDIDEQHMDVTRRSIQTICRIAEDINAVVICGGTDMGIMAETGKLRSQNLYSFPLIGVAPEALVTWQGGPRSTQFLWWGTERWELESHHSHFILVPGDHFGDESAWIVNLAHILSVGQKSVTILINGGEVSRKDIELSLQHDRQVIVLSGTGRLADEIASKPSHHKLITFVPANAQQRIVDVVKGAFSVNERIVLTRLLMISAQ